MAPEVGLWPQRWVCGPIDGSVAPEVGLWPQRLARSSAHLFFHNSICFLLKSFISRTSFFSLSLHHTTPLVQLHTSDMCDTITWLRHLQLYNYILRAIAIVCHWLSINWGDSFLLAIEGVTFYSPIPLEIRRSGIEK